MLIGVSALGDELTPCVEYHSFFCGDDLVLSIRQQLHLFVALLYGFALSTILHIRLYSCLLSLSFHTSLESLVLVHYWSCLMEDL